jgi:hypothetical protein
LYTFTSINDCTASALSQSRRSFRVLLQIGNTYDAVGIDALLLVEYCKVNFRGSNLNVPSAGCRVADLPQLLEILVEKAGVNVVSGCGKLSFCDSYGLPFGWAHGILVQLKICLCMVCVPVCVWLV